MSMYQLTNVYGNLGFWFLAEYAHGAQHQAAAKIFIPIPGRLLRRDTTPTGSTIASALNQRSTESGG